MVQETTTSSNLARFREVTTHFDNIAGAGN